MTKKAFIGVIQSLGFEREVKLEIIQISCAVRLVPPSWLKNRIILKWARWAQVKWVGASQKYVNLVRVIKFMKSVHGSRLILKKEINFGRSLSLIVDDKKVSVKAAFLHHDESKDVERDNHGNIDDVWLVQEV